MSARIDYAKASPAGYKAFGGVWDHLQNCDLPQDLVYLIYLRASQINGCAYCIDMHFRDLLKLEVAVEKLVLVPLWRGSGGVFMYEISAASAQAEVSWPLMPGRPGTRPASYASPCLGEPSQ
jgi:AhpD family alkylhydroperoxidase